MKTHRWDKQRGTSALLTCGAWWDRDVANMMMRTTSRRWLAIIGIVATVVGAPCSANSPSQAGPVGSSYAARADTGERAALAPTGVLRIGVYAGSPTSLVRDAKGNAAGIAVDLGNALAMRLGVGAEIIEFDRVAQVVAALAEGKIDVSFMNATPARASLIDFSMPLLDIEQGFLVPRGSAIRTIADCDAPGRRVGVTEGSSSQAVLSYSLRSASLVTASSIEAATELVASGKVDAYATNKSILYQMAGRLPGARVLPGAIGLEHMAVAIPKGRGAALSYVKAWAAEPPTRRLVVRAAKRAGLRGMVSPQPSQ